MALNKPVETRAAEIKWLFEERDRHLHHSRDVQLKALLAIATGFVGAFAVARNADLDPETAKCVGKLICGSVVLFLIGIWRHTVVHATHVRSCEKLLKRLIEEETKHDLKLDDCASADWPFVAEPDAPDGTPIHDWLFVAAVVILVWATWTVFDAHESDAKTCVCGTAGEQQHRFSMLSPYQSASHCDSRRIV